MSVNTFLVLFTCAISFMGFQNYGLTGKLLFDPVQIRVRREYYRFFTSGFLHGDLNHLLFNMLTLYFFGERTEIFFEFLCYEDQLLGGIAYIAFYLLAIAVSVIPTYFKYKNVTGYTSLGASGAVSAIIFMNILYDPMSKICIYFLFCIPAILFGVLYMAYTIYSSRHKTDNINHDAHLYGALFGIVFTAIFFPEFCYRFLTMICPWCF